MDKQRLTLASMWALEHIGIQEIEKEFRETITQFDAIEYLKADDALVIRGVPENLTSKIASTYSEFIDDQQIKDLLDMPRIRQLEVPAVQEEGSVVLDVTPEKGQGPRLLALDDDSDEEFIPISRDRVTKSWLSSKGGLGCFSNDFQDVLLDVSTATGTNIAVAGELQGLQVSGTTSDVDDALVKLSSVEKSLSLLLAPSIANILLAHYKNEDRFCIQSYSSLNPNAPHRVLADPNMNATTDFGEMSVTVPLSFDDESQTFTIPDNLLNPPHISVGIGQSRIWGDFTFQEIGKGDEFSDLDSIIESTPANFHSVTAGIAPPHPFLTPEKAKQVNQWVVEGVAMESGEPEPELSAEYENEIEPQLGPEDGLPTRARDGTPHTLQTVPAGKRPPGIKTRRPATMAGNASPSVKPHLANETKSTDVKPTKVGATPRKRWKMEYTPDIAQAIANDKTELTRGPSCGDMLELPNDPLQSTVQNPNNEGRLLANFDAGKYGLNRSLQTISDTRNNPHVRRMLSSRSKRRSSDLNPLIDVFLPASDSVNSTPPKISFTQAALIPQKSVPTTVSQENKMSLEHKSDLNTSTSSGYGLAITDSKSHTSLTETTGNGFALKPTTNNHSGFQDQESRLASLKQSLRERREQAHISAGNSRPHISPSEINQFLVKEKLAELKSTQKRHEQQASDEISSREFFHTMGHKMAKRSGKGKSKAEIKAKRQATLEDTWGMIKRPSQTPKLLEEAKRGSIAKIVKVRDEDNDHSQKTADTGLVQDILRLYLALKPTLEIAEYFPGILGLKVQIGLILIPLLPKTCNEGSMISFSEWTNIFQPRSGIPAPTTKFISRVTTSGHDIDQIIDLKTIRSKGKCRIFEQEYAEYSVFYEFHCRTKTAQLFIVTVDEQGKFTIKKPIATLGAVNLHFPRQIWDARVILNGVTSSDANIDSEFEEAVQYLVKYLWIQPNRSLPYLFTRLPLGNNIVVEKVLMKRWTRHRFMRSSVGMIHSDQDLFLQVMEIQDLIIGSSQSDNHVVTAYCASLPEMAEAGRQWYEIALVSPAIEAILRANADNEVGERTDEWQTPDLLGRDAALLNELVSESGTATSVLSPVAKAIGGAGLGDLLRLTRIVVEKIDFIGYRNHDPSADAPLMAEVTKSLTATKTLNGTAVVSSEGFQVERKSLDFADSESIKEAGSVMTSAMVKKSSAESSAKEEEQHELNYW